MALQDKNGPPMKMVMKNMSMDKVPLQLSSPLVHQFMPNKLKKMLQTSIHGKLMVMRNGRIKFLMMSGHGLKTHTHGATMLVESQKLLTAVTATMHGSTH